MKSKWELLTNYSGGALMDYKIVMDSCGEMTEQMKTDEHYVSVPLTLEVDGEFIVDDATFNQAEFLEKVAASPTCPRSSCPSPETYRQEFDCEAEHVYGVTLSSELSGSYNSAMLGRNLAKEDNPNKKIHIFNSRAASVAQTLIAKMVAECEEMGLGFEKTVQRIEAYIASQRTTFVLDSLEALRKNGRLSLVKAFVASALKIKPVMIATEEGTIDQIDQARGINKALVKLVEHVVERSVDSANRILGISHCNCPERAQLVKNALLDKLKAKDVIVLDTAGISSLYASDGGIIVTI